ncbi:hypothetical protein BU23DRAFT_603818 [Bimuria novae-zelandiae CBS 107.79]|uniref:Uncharacterized protein n=1 Tax=Bimuria novae-zelandiae CBS 107.79 TaxID=1447943 RepID=A0A6A5UY66_9PLEO|nr:hypothetical protein BU23DRAFT_603818 [Bimuria novae-zelandiae CBS 107.79]
MAKRKPANKPKGILKKAGAVPVPAQRRVSLQLLQNTRTSASHGNANTPVLEKPLVGLTEEQKIELDLRDHGFKNIKLPTIPPDIRLPHPKLPNNDSFVEVIMDLMQNKLFYLREYFVTEAKDLMWRGVDKKKRTPSEEAMLDEAAEKKKLLMVSHRAQDCLRLILYYEALFEKEDKDIAAGRDGAQDDKYFRREREMNVLNRGATWDKLVLEIAEQLPGNKSTREQRAEKVLHGVLDLKAKVAANDNVEKADDGGDDSSENVDGDVVNGAVFDRVVIDADAEDDNVEMVDAEPRAELAESGSSSDESSAEASEEE